MTATVLGWLITAYADHGDLILGASLAATAAWVSYRLTTWTLRRAEARRAEHAAVNEAERAARHAAVLGQARRALEDITNPDTRPGDNTTALAECEAIWQLNTRKENRP